MTPRRRPALSAQPVRPHLRRWWPALAVERLEERLAPAAGLPSALVVGRTLSAYSTADVANHSVSVTLTVYNETADDVTGVLLTDTLQPGVAFGTATQPPDRSGQNLAWSLGTIAGYDRASVTLTVTLPDPLPLTLDAGAAAFGTLNAGTETADTPAATLVGRPLPADALASTPDANTTDPFVQEQAAKLRYDPQAIFNYLNADVGYESYTGSLRGARGTLWSAAGNSLDEASLGVALLRASGVPARYAHGTLSDDLSKQLILSMFPASYQTVGYIPAGTATADPANDPKLLTETRDHYWLQFDATGGGFVDADTSGLPGGAVGHAFTTATSTFTEVADSLRHKVEVKLDAETYSQASALFGLGDGLSRSTVLDQTFNAVELVGHPLSFSQFVTPSGISSPIFSSRTTTYAPYLAVGDEAFPNLAHDTLYAGTSFQEVETNFPFGNQVLTGVFLTVMPTAPGQAAESYESTLFDRIGFAARQGLAAANVTADPNGSPALTDLDVFTLNVLAGVQNRGPIVPLAAQLLQNQSLLQQHQLPDGTLPASDLTTSRNAAISLSRLQAVNFLSLSDLSTRQLASISSVASYYTAPRLVFVTHRLVPGVAGQPTTQTDRIDLRQDAIRAVAAPGQNTAAAAGFQSAYGISESAVEGQALAGITGSSSGSSAISTAVVFDAARKLGIPFVGITANNLQALDGLGLSAEAKGRITAAVGRGMVVVVPTRSVPVGGTTTDGWYETDPATGETTGVLRDGGHEGFIETFSTLATFAIVYGLAFSPILVPGSAYLYALSHGATPKQAAEFAEAAAASWGAVTGVLGFAVLALESLFVLDLIEISRQDDPPLAPVLTNPDEPQATPRNQATATATIPAAAAAGAVAGTAQTMAAAATGSLAADWTGTDVNAFQLSTLSAVSATVSDAAGNSVGTGAVGLSAAAQATVTGPASYAVAGTGTLAFYGPAGPTLGVAGEWDGYTATVTGSPVITLTVPAGALTLNGQPLPAGTYTLTTTSATLTGRGATSSPNFAGSASVTVTGGTVNLGPGSGNLSAGGGPLDPTSGATLDGYTGTLTVAADGSPTDAVTLAGTAANVLTVAASPAALTADQNTPATFQVAANTSLADTYTVSAEAPAGWTVAVDAAGKVTVTTAPGLQGGTYPVRVVVTSGANAKLVAQTTVNVAVAATRPGLTLAVSPDNQFTVPYNGAQLPTAFRASVQNLGPAADTYTLSFANLPAGFTLLDSGTRLTVSAGQTGLLGLYLQPAAGTPLPAPGTVLTFTVTATSTTDPTLTRTQTVTFTVPEVHAVTVVPTPASAATVPGGSADVTFTLQAVGNVPETVTLATTAGSGLTVSGVPASVTLAVGQSTTVTAHLTAAADTPLNSTLALSLTATAGPSTQTVQVPVRVVVPGADAIAAASASATALGNGPLANQLNNLATALTTLFQHPGDPVPLGQATAALTALVPLVNADPFTAPAAAGLTAGRDQLAAATTAADVAAAITALGVTLGQLNDRLTALAGHRFDLFLATNTGLAQPGVPTVFQVGLTNTGSLPTTYDLSVTGLPAGVTGTFSPAAVTLQPGQTLFGGATGVTLSLSVTGSSLEPTGFAVVATPRDAAGLTRSVTGSLTVRPEFVHIAAVTVSPPFGNPGTAVAVGARVLNAVNKVQPVSATFTLTDSTGAVKYTSPATAGTLTIDASLITLALGSVDTTSLAKGTYTVTVTLSDASGTPIPGATGTASLLVGTPVTATLTSSPATLPQGDGTVTSTLTVSTQNGAGQPFALAGAVNVDGAAGVVQLGQYAYVGANGSIHQIDLTDPTNPRDVQTFGAADFDAGRSKVAGLALDGDRLVVNTSDGFDAGNTLLVYSLTDPAHPALLGKTDLTPFLGTSYTAIGPITVVNHHVYTSSFWFRYFLSGHQVFGQWGQSLVIDISDPTKPTPVKVIYNGQPDPTFTYPDGNRWPDGTSNVWQVAAADDTTVLIGTTADTHGSEDGPGQILVVDASDPNNPTVVRTVTVPGMSVVTGISVRGTTAFVNGSSKGWKNGQTDLGLDGVEVVARLDLTDPRNPVVVSTQSLTAPSEGTSFVADLGGGLYATVGVPGVPGSPAGLVLLDATNPASVQNSPQATPRAVNGFTAAAGNELLVTDGAQVFVYTYGSAFPAPLTQIGQVQTTPAGTGVALVGTRAYVAGTNGLDVVDVTDPTAPRVTGTFGGDLIVQGGASALRLVGTHTLVVGSSSTLNPNGTTLLVYDLAADPDHPALVSNTLVPFARLSDLEVSGSTVLLTTLGTTFSLGDGTIFSQFGDVVAIDLSDPAHPAVVKALEDTTRPDSGTTFKNDAVFVTPTTAYVSGSTSTGGNTQAGVGRVQVLDVTTPAALAQVGEVQIPGTVQVVAVGVQGDRALVVGSDGGLLNPFGAQSNFGLTGHLTLSVLDTSDPLHPRLLGATLTTAFTFPHGSVSKLSVRSLGNGRFAVSNALDGDTPVLLLVDPTDPSDIAVTRTAAPALVSELAVAGDLLYTTSAAGLGVYRIGQFVSTPVTATVRVPHGSVVPGSFNSPPSHVVSGTDYDLLVWNRQLAYGTETQTFTWQSKVTGLTAGETRPVVLDGQVRAVIPTPGTEVTSFDAVTDFAIAANPNGPWQYLYDTGGGLVPLTDTLSVQQGDATVIGWINDNAAAIPNRHFIGKSTGPAYSDPNYPSVIETPDLLRLDPEAGAVSTRWTAPTAGTWQFDGWFQGTDTNEHSHSVKVVLNGSTVLLTQTVSAYNQLVPFSYSLSLHAGDTLDFIVASTGDPNNLSTGLAVTVSNSAVTVPLAGTQVAAAPIIGLAPPTATAAPGGPAMFTITLANPAASPVTYTLAAVGVPAGWVGLPATVSVAAGATQTVTLTLTPDLFARLADYGFTVTAAGNNGAKGSVQGTLTVAGTPVSQPDPDAHGAVLALTPAAVAAGRGTPVRTVVRVTNTGSATATFALTLAGLPAGVTATFDQTSVTVPPGAGNFREVALTLTPAADTDPVALPFTVTATAGTTTATATGTLTVVAQGVTVTLDRTTAAPGDTLMATVTNTGTAADTFDLSAAGPAGLVATFAGPVTLAPGESTQVPVTTSAATFAVPGPLGLMVSAKSQANPAATGAASATLSVPGTVGLTATLDPAAVTLPAPGPTSFTLTVQNTGNTEDAYTVTVDGVTGPVTAYLVGLDGNPTQTIPTVRLPGLASGQVRLTATLTGPGNGSVTVTVRSLTDPTRFVTTTSTLRTATVVVPPVVPPPPGSPPPPPAVLKPQPALAGGTTDGSAVVLAPAGGAYTVGQTLDFFPDFGGPVRTAVGDLTGDGVADYVGGAGPGGGPRVVLIDGATGRRIADFFAFEDSFRGGVAVSVADLDGDGTADLIVTPGVGGGPVVAVYSGARLTAGQTPEQAQLGRFYAFDKSYRGGATAAGGDLDGDGHAELVVTAGVPGGPRVAVFSGADVVAGSANPTRLVPDFFAFEEEYTGVVEVAVGDLTGDGRADVVFGAGPGGGPRVRALDGGRLLADTSFTTLDAAIAADPDLQLVNRFADDPSLRGGVRVAVRDATGSGRDDLLVASGVGGAGKVWRFAAADALAGQPAAQEIDPFPGRAEPFGVYVG